MASLINFGYRVDEQLGLIDDAVSYTLRATNNLLYESGLNSPYRILLEAQIYVYNQYLLTLRNLEQEIRLIFFELLGFTPQIARRSVVTLKFEILETRIENTYFAKGFPVRGNNGKLFTTDATLTIPSGSKIGYVTATATKPGSDGNLPSNTINQGLKLIDVSYKVTNERASEGGTNGEQISNLSNRVGYFIRGNHFLTAQDVYDYIKTVNSNFVSSVDVGTDNTTLDIYVCYRDGSSLTPTDFNALNGDIQNRKPLGIAAITLHQMTVITVYIEVIVDISKGSQFAKTVADGINSKLRLYVRPDNLTFINGGSRGLIINNELEYQAKVLYANFIHSVSIGVNEISAYAENFVFNPINERVKVGTVKVDTIDGTFRKDFVYTA